MTDPVFLEHLRHLCGTHRASKVSRAIGVSQTAISLVLSGKRDASADFVQRLTSQFPLPESPKPQAARQGDQKQNPESVWLNTETARTTDLIRRAEDSKDERDEIDRLISHPEYQAMRGRVLLATTGVVSGLDDVLLDPPTTGPTVAMREAIDAVRAVIVDSEARQKTIDPERSSDLYRRHSQFREALRRKLEKLEKGDDVSELINRSAWRTTVTSVCAMLRDDGQARSRVIESLGPEGFEVALRQALEGIRSISFPCTQFQNDPVGFVQTILGEDPWEDPDEKDDDQVTLLESVREHKRTVGPSARGVGKTKGVGWLAWWRYCSWEDGRVCISNFTGNQLRTQDWAEILRCLNRSGICLDCRRAGVKQRPCPHSQIIDATPSETPTKGIWSNDKERFIVGITGKEATALGGYHGVHILVICDEFSGLTREMYNAWKGNIAGPEARFFGPGNCLDSAGSPMYDAVNDERERTLYDWNVVRLSAETAARTRLPYLPDANELLSDEKSDERGKDNPLYMINNLGLYPKFDELCIYQPQHIIRAQSPDIYEGTESRGRLIIPIDPSGEGGQGDEACVGAVRGLKVLEKRVARGWTREDYLNNVIELAENWRNERNEEAIVAVDADGVGQRIIGRLYDYLETKRLAPHEKVRFEIVSVYFGQRAPAQFDFDTVADEAHHHLSRWLARGGVFRADEKLQREMQHSKWSYVSRNRDGVIYIVRRGPPKFGAGSYHEALHRSPDRLDMLRVFAYAAYMKDALVVNDERTEEAKQDEEMQFTPVDERLAFRTHMRRIKKGQFG